MDTLQELMALMRYLAAANHAWGETIADLYRECRGKVSDETSDAIHQRLRLLSDLALALPRDAAALAVLDQLVEMFPPPRQSPR